MLPEPAESVSPGASMASSGSKRFDFSQRASPKQNPEWMDEPCSRDEMRACLRDLERVNRILLGYRPVIDWFRALLPKLHSIAAPIRILDVGCGYGDTLRQVAAWASANGLQAELTGLDLNADTISIAAEASRKSWPIRFVAGDVFSHIPKKAPHLIISSLFTHHLEDDEVMRFLRWMEANAEIGWCINDLSRDQVPFRLFGWFASLMRLHRFVRHDGPVSIARSFRESDWIHYCAAAGLPADEVEIRGFTPGRLRVSRSR